ALLSVYDVVGEAAAEVAASHHCKAAGTVEEILSDDAVDAVLIASPTDTHADLLEAGAKAGKAVFCEKPIDLSLERVDRCATAIAACDVLIQIGFNRRFDPGHRAARQALEAGEIGDLHQVIITSRDPEIPPRDYLESAGGLFRDMTIHDFDLARFMLGEEPEAVFAIAGALGDPALGAELDEIDSAMIIMRSASGKMCHINNSRSAVYGYDQRVELLGNSGMVISDNRKSHELRRYSASQTEAGQPYLYFFIERYCEAFIAELDAFIDAVEHGTPCEVGFDDGHRALMLAEAAYRSLQSGTMVKVGAAG
ncbi:MAG TPA: inositol 2-dehydrogenase, partial [Afifellaceae bacterium]|nr:inositol 2-dehydrogenase [Afifellaceae bacterium]